MTSDYGVLNQAFRVLAAPRQDRIVSQQHIATVKRNARWMLRDYLRDCQSDWRWPSGMPQTNG